MRMLQQYDTDRAIGAHHNADNVPAHRHTVRGASTTKKTEVRSSTSMTDTLREYYREKP